LAIIKTKILDKKIFKGILSTSVRSHQRSPLLPLSTRHRCWLNRENVQWALVYIKQCMWWCVGRCGGGGTLSPTGLR